MFPVKSSTPVDGKRGKLLAQRRRSNAALLRELSADQLAALQRRRCSGQKQLISDLYHRGRRRSSASRKLTKNQLKKLTRVSTVSAPDLFDTDQSKLSRKRKLLKRTRKTLSKLRKRDSRITSSEASSISRITDTCTSGANLSSTVDEVDDSSRKEVSSSHSVRQSDDIQEQRGVKRLDFSSPSKLFESMIFPVSSQEFFTRYWEKEPLVLRGYSWSSDSTTPLLASLFSLADLKGLVRDTSIEFGSNINVCRYSKGKRHSMNREGRLTAERLEELWKKKATFQFHQPQQFKVKGSTPTC